ncbi:hypothetical protein Tco_0056252 [Tanacetum coccineum]
MGSYETRGHDHLQLSSPTYVYYLRWTQGPSPLHSSPLLPHLLSTIHSCYPLAKVMSSRLFHWLFFRHFITLKFSRNSGDSAILGNYLCFDFLNRLSINLIQGHLLFDSTRPNSNRNSDLAVTPLGFLNPFTPNYESN